MNPKCGSGEGTVKKCPNIFNNDFYSHMCQILALGICLIVSYNQTTSPSTCVIHVIDALVVYTSLKYKLSTTSLMMLQTTNKS
ncbi:hypothetical protein Y032_0181g842 [Ancylostoma ceylanicum]|uniref:Uncharacterized protein n=1 Tax=Ancylostoma ceylanicum TaxID=53326 RepID=A0A016ST08_9BILA|nr:hypothetical protein Y032_0181g842 [Ancylostoma ceylanicum]